MLNLMMIEQNLENVLSLSLAFSMGSAKLKASWPYISSIYCKGRLSQSSVTLGIFR